MCMCQGIIFPLKFDKQFQSIEKYFELLYTQDVNKQSHQRCRANYYAILFPVLDNVQTIILH